MNTKNELLQALKSESNAYDLTIENQKDLIKYLQNKVHNRDIDFNKLITKVDRFLRKLKVIDIGQYEEYNKLRQEIKNWFICSDDSEDITDDGCEFCNDIHCGGSCQDNDEW